MKAIELIRKAAMLLDPHFTLAGDAVVCQELYALADSMEKQNQAHVANTKSTSADSAVNSASGAPLEPVAIRWRGKQDDDSVLWKYQDFPRYDLNRNELPNTIIQDLFLHPASDEVERLKAELDDAKQLIRKQGRELGEQDVPLSAIRKAIEKDKAAEDAPVWLSHDEAHYWAAGFNKCIYSVRDILNTINQAHNIAGDMCPNCVTPWKCNGPHTLPAQEQEGK